MNDFNNLFNEVSEMISRAGEKYAACKSARYMCEKEEKRTWSECYLNAKRQSGTSVKDAEALANRHTDYIKKTELTTKAIENELNARKDYEIALAKQEAIRSLCSQETAKIKLQ